MAYLSHISAQICGGSTFLAEIGTIPIPPVIDKKTKASLWKYFYNPDRFGSPDRIDKPITIALMFEFKVE